jgi:PAS domain S-box-containing protein
MTKKEGRKKNKLTVVEQLQVRPTEFLIVGIGASAGGIRALQEFFSHVPSDSDIAYVVILHLSPNHDSELASVLQSQSKIPVTQVTDKTSIEKNQVYVVPPDHHLTIDGGDICVMPNIHIEERRAPVDIFFRTLADEHGPRAVSVVLSGTGANGSMGLKRIKERGGAAFVQNPREAEYNEMPRSAIATGLVDDVLNVADIPSRIIAYRDSIGKIQIVDEAETRPELQQKALRDIFAQIRVRTGNDFSNYKRPTLLRRIERRINVHNLPDLPSYSAYMSEHPDEAQLLLKDLLISVTNFFRDEKAFLKLQHNILPAIFEGKTSNDQIRIWVAGCATGEEAYSVAMLCAEISSNMFDAPKVQIFATDIDEAAVAVAREGLYTLNDAADVSPERLRRFFIREGDDYRVRREIREIILFAHHNFLKDPPFSKLDMISCRNVLIYLNRTAQERVLETFHFALKTKKFLLLGTSESVDMASDLYTLYDRDQHIFQAREALISNYPVPESVPQFQFQNNDPLHKVEDQGKRPPRVSFGELHQRMLEQYAPPSVVVNQEYDLVHMTERAGKYFEFTAGEPTRNLLKLIRPAIRLELRSALYQAVHNKIAVETQNLSININGVIESLDIQVRPVFEDEDVEKGFILILFKPSDEATQNHKPVKVASDEPIARHMEEELIALKIQLRNSIEQHEYQAEELKASNEELQAMNEELRSSAEELETGKEELQSINEELRTVNQELKIKIEETSVNSNNLQNLVNSANIGTIFLDRNFSIRFFTPAALDIFNLKSGDYGRPITDITHKLLYEGLFKDAEQVLEHLSVLEREVGTVDDRYFMMRVVPYRTSEDRINGVVITFFDITKRRASGEALRQSEERMRLLVESAKDYAIFMLDIDRRIVSWNMGAQMMTGYSETEIKGEKSDILFTKEDRQLNLPEEEIKNAELHGIAEDERWHLRKDGTTFWGSGSVSPLRDENGKLIGFVKIMRDLTVQRNEITERIKNENLIKDYTTRLEREVADRTSELHKNYSLVQTIYDTTLIGMSVFAPIRDEQGKIIDFKIMMVNKKIEKSTNRTDMVGKLYSELYPGIKDVGLFDMMVRTLETGETSEMEYHYTNEGMDNWYSTMLVKGDDILVSTNLDITERMHLEEKRQRAFVLLQQSEELAGIGSWEYDLMTGHITWSDGMYRLFSLEKDEQINPQIYLKYATADSLSAAEHVVSALKTGEDNVEERLEISIGCKIKVLRLKATVVKNSFGEPVSVLGVDMDVTALEEAQKRLRKMETLQQQEILQVTLNTQEEERRRISESLHNGVGQLLYGTQLSMNHLTVKSAIENPDKFNEFKAYTTKLLRESIKDVRRISHELMPTVLAELGLKTAIEDVCKQLQDGVTFDCKVLLDDKKLDDYLELAVFRTVQELVVNIIKHADATDAKVEVRATDRLVIITVNDNGKGIPAQGADKPGIGISSIRNKVELLKGKINIKSESGNGTTIQVQYPLRTKVENK